MRVNGTNSFKSQDVETTNLDSGRKAVEDAFDELFGDDPSSTPVPTSSDPLDVYFQDGPSADSSDEQSVSDKLGNIPDLEKVLATYPNMDNYLELLKQKYEKLDEGLIKLRDNYIDNLANFSAAEAQLAREKIAEYNNYHTFIGEQLTKIEKRIEEHDSNLIQETRSGLDLDGNGMIGNDIGVVTDENGKIHYIDPTTGKEIRGPIVHADYEPSFLSKDSPLQMIKAEEAAGNPLADDDLEDKADIYLKLDGDAYANKPGNEYNNMFRTTVDLKVPPVIWVKKEEGTNEPLLEDGRYVIDPKSFTQEGGGLKQTIPEDLSKYYQVTVAYAGIYSEKCVGPETNDDIYNTYIEYRAEDETGPVICRIRIEGDYTPRAHPAAVECSGDRFYVDASRISYSVDPAEPAYLRPVVLDGSAFVSNCHHIVPDLLEREDLDLEIPDPNSQEGMAFWENLASFGIKPDGSTGPDENFKTRQWSIKDEDGKVLNPEESLPDDEKATKHTGSYSEDGCIIDHTYDDYGTSYDGCAKGDLATLNAGDPLRTDAAGLFISGFHGGVIRGSQGANNFIVVGDPNEEHKIDGKVVSNTEDPILPGDPLYTTVVDGGGCNSVVKATKGSLFATGVSFVDVDDGYDVAVGVIQEPKDVDSSTEEVMKEKPILVRDPKCYVNTDAKRSWLYNPSESDVSKAYDGSYKDSLNNDYYKLGGEKYALTIEKDIVDHDKMSETGRLDATTWNDMRDKAEKDIEDTIANFGLDEDFDPGPYWKKMQEENAAGSGMDPSDELAAEVKDIFDAIFGDFKDIMSEADVE